MLKYVMGAVLTREGKMQVHLLYSSKLPFFRYFLSIFYSSKRSVTSAVISVFFFSRNSVEGRTLLQMPDCKRT